MTTAVRLGPAAQAWRDPEFWGPRGLGCARCHEHPPIVLGVGFEHGNGALCENCLAQWFPGWDFEQLANWLGRQRETLIRNERRAAAVAAADTGNLIPAMQYEEIYGVWLISWRPSP